MRTITSKSFSKFGKVIEYGSRAGKGNKRNLWKILHVEKSKVGWRVAYLVLRDKTIGRLECHPFSDETFEPVKGKSIIFLSEDKDYNNIQCFKLDKPIIVRKGIWHGLISLSSEAEIKITENSKVSARYWKLPSRIRNLAELKKFIKL